VSAFHPLTTASSCHFQTAAHCPFPAPSISDFYFKPLFTIGSVQITKPVVLALFSALLVVAFFWYAFRSPQLVPRATTGKRSGKPLRFQNLGELGILFVRDQILRPQLGKKGDKWLPFLCSLFFFIWVMNIMGIIPFLQFPPASKYAIPVFLAGMVWIIFISIGIKHQGPYGYFRNIAVPSGAPWWILPLLVPIELFSNIIVRPFTLSVRLFANMLAGHVLLLVFSLATWYLLTFSISALYATASFALVIVLTGLEVLIQALQAFIFTILTATYISGAYEPAH
jgi:F-type H+-transporting ATPase subunit a